MMARSLQIAMGASCVGALAAAAWVIRPSAPAQLPVALATTARVGAAPRAEHPALDSLTAAAAGKAPFRASRAAPRVRYDVERPVIAGAVTAPAGPRPVLAVSGIAWGGTARASAVIEGLPGSEGARVVRAGEVVAGLRVRRIQPNLVIVTATDTTWTLHVREPWK